MKYLSIIVVAALALVSCGGELDACGCLEEGISQLEAVESLEDYEAFAEWEAAHPECGPSDDKEAQEAAQKEIEENCPEAVAKLATVAMEKAGEFAK